MRMRSGCLVAAGLGLFATQAAADGQQMKPSDLVELSAIGLQEFQAELGAEAYSQIYAITSILSDDGDGATLKYYFGDRAARTHATLFCHEHDPGELDCHVVSP